MNREKPFPLFNFDKRQSYLRWDIASFPHWRLVGFDSLWDFLSPLTGAGEKKKHPYVISLIIFFNLS